MGDIILIGPKHSGKTSVGRALAQLCSCEFIDLDELIRERTRESPRQLFIKGQAVFQKAEAQAVEALFGGDGAGLGAKGQRVIATGGGIIDNAEAVALLKKTGAKKVFIDISAKSAWGRIAVRKELPPFLRTKNPQKTHRVLHKRRSSAYRYFADIVIKAEGKAPEEIAEEILKRRN